MSENFPLRPYQTEAVQAILDAISKNKRRMSVHMATGTGIHRVGAELIRRLASSSEKQKSRKALPPYLTAKNLSNNSRTYAKISARKGTDSDWPALPSPTQAKKKGPPCGKAILSSAITEIYPRRTPIRRIRFFKKCKIRGRQLPERERKTDFRYLRRRLIGYTEN